MTSVAAYRVTFEARLEPSVNPSTTGAALMEQILEFGATSATLRQDGHNFEVHVLIEARTEADALAKGSRLVARSLDGEPVHAVTARVDRCRG